MRHLPKFGVVVSGRAPVSVAHAAPARSKSNQTFKRIGADDLHRRIGAHRRGFINLGNDLPGHVRVDHKPACGIAADRQSLALVNRKRIHALAYINGLRCLVFGHAFGCHVKRALIIRRRRNVGPFLRLGVQINHVALFIGHNTLRTLDRQNSLFGLLVSSVKRGLQFCHLGVNQRIGCALAFNGFQARIVGFLELAKRFVDRLDGLFDFVRHGMLL